MPAEIRFAAFAALIAAALPVLASGSAPWICVLAVVALLLAAAGLVPPLPPMVNGLAAVLPGALLAGLAATSGHTGLAVLLAAPLAVASLRLGWRPVVWAAALSLLSAAVLDFGAFQQPWLAAGVYGWVTVGLLLIWGVAHMVLGRQFAGVEPAFARPLTP